MRREDVNEALDGGPHTSDGALRGLLQQRLERSRLEAPTGAAYGRYA